MKTKKILALALCAVLLVCGSVLGTMAYLTAQDAVTNTFTVGNVAITLDEQDVDKDANEKDNVTINGVVRDKANSYKLLPGQTYTKDPTVHVTAGSEESYIRMFVTIDKLSALDDIFATQGADLKSIFTGYEADKWIYASESEKDDAITYEFRYHTTVENNTDEAIDLEPLFTGIAVPEFINNDQLAAIANMTINVVAEAIQADGFDNADKAWAAFDAQ